MTQPACRNGQKRGLGKHLNLGEGGGGGVYFKGLVSPISVDFIVGSCTLFGATPPQTLQALQDAQTLIPKPKTLQDAPKP